MSRPVERWLGTFMCAQYADAFESHGYKTLQSVCQLSFHHLQSMRVRPEHCEKVMENVSVLRQSYGPGGGSGSENIGPDSGGRGFNMAGPDGRQQNSNYGSSEMGMRPPQGMPNYPMNQQMGPSMRFPYNPMYGGPPRPGYPSYMNMNGPHSDYNNQGWFQGGCRPPGSFSGQNQQSGTYDMNQSRYDNRQSTASYPGDQMYGMRGGGSEHGAPGLNSQQPTGNHPPEIISSPNDNLQHTDSNLSNQGGNMSNQGGNMPNQGGNIPNPGGNMPNPDGSMSNQGGNMSNQGGHMPNEGGNMLNQGGNMSNQGGNMSNQGGNMSNQGGNMHKQGGNMHSHGGNISNQGGNMFNQGGNMHNQGGNMQNQGSNLFNQGGNMPIQDGNMHNQGGSITDQDGSTTDQGGNMPNKAAHVGNMLNQGGNMPNQGGNVFNPSGSMANHSGSMPSQGDNMHGSNTSMSSAGDHILHQDGNIANQGSNQNDPGGSMHSQGGNMPSPSDIIPNRSGNRPGLCGSMSGFNSNMQSSMPSQMPSRQLAHPHEQQNPQVADSSPHSSIPPRMPSTNQMSGSQASQSPQQVADTILHMASSNYQCNGPQSLDQGRYRQPDYAGSSMSGAQHHMMQNIPNRFPVPPQPGHYPYSNNPSQMNIRSPMSPLSVRSPSSMHSSQGMPSASPGQMQSPGPMQSPDPSQSPMGMGAGAENRCRSSVSSVSSPGMVGIQSPNPNMPQPMCTPAYNVNPPMPSPMNPSPMHQMHPMGHPPPSPAMQMRPQSQPPSMHMNHGSYNQPNMPMQQTDGSTYGTDCGPPNSGQVSYMNLLPPSNRNSSSGYMSSQPSTSMQSSYPLHNPARNNQLFNPLQSLQRLVMLPEGQVVDPKSVVSDANLLSPYDMNRYDDMFKSDVMEPHPNGNEFSSNDLVPLQNRHLCSDGRHCGTDIEEDIDSKIACSEILAPNTPPSKTKSKSRRRSLKKSQLEPDTEETCSKSHESKKKSPSRRGRKPRCSPSSDRPKKTRRSSGHWSPRSQSNLSDATDDLSDDYLPPRTSYSPKTYPKSPSSSRKSPRKSPTLKGSQSKKFQCPAETSIRHCTVELEDISPLKNGKSLSYNLTDDGFFLVKGLDNDTKCPRKRLSTSLEFISHADDNMLRCDLDLSPRAKRSRRRSGHSDHSDPGQIFSPVKKNGIHVDISISGCKLSPGESISVKDVKKNAVCATPNIPVLDGKCSELHVNGNLEETSLSEVTVSSLCDKKPIHGDEQSSNCSPTLSECQTKLSISQSKLVEETNVALDINSSDISSSFDDEPKNVSEFLSRSSESSLSNQKSFEDSISLDNEHDEKSSITEVQSHVDDSPIFSDDSTISNDEQNCNKSNISSENSDDDSVNFDESNHGQIEDPEEVKKCLISKENCVDESFNLMDDPCSRENIATDIQETVVDENMANELKNYVQNHETNFNEESYDTVITELQGDELREEVANEPHTETECDNAGSLTVATSDKMAKDLQASSEAEGNLDEAICGTIVEPCSEVEEEKESCNQDIVSAIPDQSEVQALSAQVYNPCPDDKDNDGGITKEVENANSLICDIKQEVIQEERQALDQSDVNSCMSKEYDSGICNGASPGTNSDSPTKASDKENPVESGLRRGRRRRPPVLSAKYLDYSSDEELDLDEPAPPKRSRKPVSRSPKLSCVENRNQNQNFTTVALEPFSSVKDPAPTQNVKNHSSIFKCDSKPRRQKLKKSSLDVIVNRLSQQMVERQELTIAPVHLLNSPNLVVISPEKVTSDDSCNHSSRKRTARSSPVQAINSESSNDASIIKPVCSRDTANVSDRNHNSVEDVKTDLDAKNVVSNSHSANSDSITDLIRALPSIDSDTHNTGVPNSGKLLARDQIKRESSYKLTNAQMDKGAEQDVKLLLNESKDNDSSIQIKPEGSAGSKGTKRKGKSHGNRNRIPWGKTSGQRKKRSKVFTDDCSDDEKLKKVLKLKLGKKDKKNGYRLKVDSQLLKGPYVKVKGTKEAPESCEVVNLQHVDREKNGKKSKGRSKPECHLDGSSAAISRMSSTLPWLCAFCGQGSNHDILGDLFGPYFLEKNAFPLSPLKKDNQFSPNAGSSKGKSLKRTGSPEGKRQLTTPPGKGSKRSRLTSPTPKDIRPPTEVWLHEDCIVWTSGIFAMGRKIHGLEEALQESKHSICSMCKTSGATLGCFQKACNQKYHYICALSKDCYLDEENFSLLCLKHKEKKFKSPAPVSR